MPARIGSPSSGRDSDFARQRRAGRAPFRDRPRRARRLSACRRVSASRGSTFGSPRFALRRLDLLADLQIGAEAAAAQCDFEAGHGIFAQHLLALHAVGARRNLPGEVAIRIIRAADEGAEPAGLERQLPGGALRALAARHAVGAHREDVRLEQVVERVEHDAIAHFLDVVHRADEVRPELGEHRRANPSCRAEISSSFSSRLGGEIVFDITREEALEEGDDDAAFVFGNEPLLVDAHIAAVLQHLQDRGVGRGPADAELFHALDQRGFGEARRRLGEMLRATRSPACCSVSPSIDRRAGGATLRLRRSRPGLPDRASESRRTSPPGRWRAGRCCGAPALAAMSTVVRSSSALSIWLATARFQISS